MPNVVIIKGSPRYDEANADAAITPGHLVERTATGIKVHATADGAAGALFALTDPSNSESWDTAYAANERAAFGAFKRGDQVNAILAASQTAVVSSPLGSNGDGTLKVITVGATTLEGALVARAREAVTTTGAVARIIVEVA